MLWLPTTALLLGFTILTGPLEVRNRLATWAGPVSRSRLRPWVGSAVALAALLLIAAVVLWVLYGFRVMPFWTVLTSQLWDLSCGHEAYLFGRYSTEGWWYYFPIAFLVKTPVPTLLLGFWGVMTLVRDDARRWDHGLLLLPPAVFFSAFILSEGKALGLRYLLPIYPFLFVVAGASMQTAWSATRRWRRRAVMGLCAALLLTTAGIHPDHLAYFNDMAGGPDGGHRILVDSNLDWGQDLKGLKTWMDERGVARVKLSYFGSVDPALYDLDYDWLPSYVLPNRGATVVELPTTGWIAISVTNRVGVYMDMYGHGKGLFEWLDAYEPVARIGHTILVYRIPDETP